MIGSEYLLQFAEIQVSDSASEINRESNQLIGAMVTADSSLENLEWGKPLVVDGIRASASGSFGYSSSYESGRNTADHIETLYFSTSCAKTYSKVVLYPRAEPGYVDFGFPIDFTIAFWNGTGWDAKVEPKGYALPGGKPQTFSWGSNYTTDKIRIQATKLRNLEPYISPAGDYVFQLAEVEAYP